MFGILELVLAGLGLYIIYTIYWELTTGTARRQLKREYGCQPPKKLADWDPFFGIGTFKATAQAVKEHRLLEVSEKRFRENGNTFAVNLMGMYAISTIEPENLKTLQSLDFKKWSLGTRRIRYFTDFLGPGIFSTNGQAWAHSREMLRPNFSKTQVADLDTFEHHVHHLIDAIPRNGSPVELQELFFRLTIDSATEFLFGESTNCLAPGTSSVSSNTFANAFNKCQIQVTEKSRRGIFNMFFTDQGYESNRDYVHSKSESNIDSNS